MAAELLLHHVAAHAGAAMHHSARSMTSLPQLLTLLVGKPIPHLVTQPDSVSQHVPMHIRHASMQLPDAFRIRAVPGHELLHFVAQIHHVRLARELLTTVLTAEFPELHALIVIKIEASHHFLFTVSWIHHTAAHAPGALSIPLAGAGLTAHHWAVFHHAALGHPSMTTPMHTAAVHALGTGHADHSGTKKQRQTDCCPACAIHHDVPS
jgi:hypothetical protein